MRGGREEEGEGRQRGRGARPRTRRRPVAPSRPGGRRARRPRVRGGKCCPRGAAGQWHRAGLSSTAAPPSGPASPPPRPAGRGVHPRTIHLWVVGESGLMDVCFAGHRMRAFKMCNSVALGIYELCGHVHHQFWSTFTPRKETLHPFRCPSLPQNYFSGAAVTNDHTLSGLRQ